ncbi:MAG: outer membrane protein assembly factor BamA [Sphingobacteriales bacterium]|nr:MAG: outer membrane protein assembly factor BamA [Sphingobacteriales bacterium]
MTKFFFRIALLILLFILSFYNVNAQDTTNTKSLPVISYEKPSTYEIGGITVTGTKYVDEIVLISYTGLNVGDKISIPGDEIPNAIKALWRQGLFSDVKILASKIVNEIVFLEIRLTERVRLSKYSFNGVKKGEEDDLRENLSLIKGRIVTQNLLNNAQNSIINFYRKKGFLNSEVKIIQTPDPLFSNSVILQFDVSRKNKVKIDEIVFIGNENVSSRSLKKQLKETKERLKINTKAPIVMAKDLAKINPVEFLGNLNFGDILTYIDENIFRFKLFTSSKLIEDDYEADKLKLITYYHEKGYRDARIISDTVHIIDEKKIKLEINLEEGNRYYIRDIAWRGNTKYTNEQLNAILNIDKGDVYNKTRLETRLSIDPNGNDVSSLYMDDGYLFFNVTPVEKAVVGDSIDLVINVYEGPQATISKIIISGNDKTNEHVIRRELRTLPGNKFSRSDIIRSQREIANLGFFDPEQIQITPMPNPTKGTVDIEYKVVEKSSDQLELSAGWGGNTIVGSVGVAFNNFSLRNIPNKSAWRPLPAGDGQRLSFRFQSTGKAFQSLNGSFTEPWLGGKRPNALTVSVFSSRSFRNFFVADLNDNQRELLYITGASVGLGRRLQWPDDNFSIQTSINYQRYNLQNWRSDFLLTNGQSNNLSVTTTFARYSLDQPIYPRSGSNISLSVQATPPFSAIFNSGVDYSLANDSKKYKWAEYHKWKLKAEWFTALGSKLVLRTSAKMGAMGYYNPDIGHSPFERFEVGGDGIANFNLYGKDIVALRGYEATEVTRRTTNVGHPFYAKYTVELRYPLSLNPSSTIFALAFAEGGNSWATFKKFNPFEVNRSAGIGLRVFLPMFGTLGFDYGVGFDKNLPADSSIWNYISNRGRFNVVLGLEPE